MTVNVEKSNDDNPLTRTFSVNYPFGAKIDQEQSLKKQQEQLRVLGLNTFRTDTVMKPDNSVYDESKRGQVTVFGTMISSDPDASVRISASEQTGVSYTSSLR